MANKETPWWFRKQTFHALDKLPKQEDLLQSLGVSRAVNKPPVKQQSAKLANATAKIDKAVGAEWRTSPESKNIWKFLYAKEQAGGISEADIAKAVVSYGKKRLGEIDADVAKIKRKKFPQHNPAKDVIGIDVPPEVLVDAIRNKKSIDIDTSTSYNPISYNTIYKRVKAKTGMLPEEWADKWEASLKKDEKKAKAQEAFDKEAAKPKPKDPADVIADIAKLPATALNAPITAVNEARKGWTKFFASKNIQDAIAQVEQSAGRKFTQEELDAIGADKDLQAVLANKELIGNLGVQAMPMLLSMGANVLGKGAAFGTDILMKTAPAANKLAAASPGLAKAATTASRFMPDLYTTPYVAQLGSTGVDALAGLAGGEQAAQRTQEFLKSVDPRTPAGALGLGLNMLGVFGAKHVYKSNSDILKMGAAQRAVTPEMIEKLATAESKVFPALKAQEPVKGPSVPRTDDLPTVATVDTPSIVEAPQTGTVDVWRAKAAEHRASAEARRAQSATPSPQGKGRRGGSSVKWGDELLAVLDDGIATAYELGADLGDILKVKKGVWMERMKEQHGDRPELPQVWTRTRMALGFKSTKGTIAEATEVVSPKNSETEKLAHYLGIKLDEKPTSKTLEQMEKLADNVRKKIGDEAFAAQSERISMEVMVQPGRVLTAMEQAILGKKLRSLADELKAKQESFVSISRNSNTERRTASELGKDIVRIERDIENILNANRRAGTNMSAAFRARQMELHPEAAKMRAKVEITKAIKRPLTAEESVELDGLYSAADVAESNFKKVLGKRALAKMERVFEHEGKAYGERVKTATDIAELDDLRRRLRTPGMHAHTPGSLIADAAYKLPLAANLMFKHLTSGSTMDEALADARAALNVAGLEVDEADLVTAFVTSGFDFSTLEGAQGARRAAISQLEAIGQEITEDAVSYHFRLAPSAQAAKGITARGAEQTASEAGTMRAQASAYVEGDVTLPTAERAHIEYRDATNEDYERSIKAINDRIQAILDRTTTPKAKTKTKFSPEMQEALDILTVRAKQAGKRRDLEMEIKDMVESGALSGEAAAALSGKTNDQLQKVISAWNRSKSASKKKELVGNAKKAEALPEEVQVEVDALLKEAKEREKAWNIRNRYLAHQQDGRIPWEVKANNAPLKYLETQVKRADKLKTLKEQVKLIEETAPSLPKAKDAKKLLDNELWEAHVALRGAQAKLNNAGRSMVVKEMIKGAKAGNVRDMARSVGMLGKTTVGLIRSSVASFDNSAMFTQGGRVVLNPFFWKPWAKSAAYSWKALVSEKLAFEEQLRMEGSALWGIAEQSGLHINRSSQKLSRHEDVFAAETIDYINKLTHNKGPVVAITGLPTLGISASNRAMQGFTNSLRLRMFENLVGAAGGVDKVAPEELSNIANIINNLTGRATGKGEAVGNYLGHIFFSGHFTASGPQAYIQRPLEAAASLVGAGPLAKSHWKVRAAAASGIVSVVGSLATLDQLLRIAGHGYVDMDHESKDFLKVKFWGGDDPNLMMEWDIVPLFAQMARAAVGLGGRSVSESGVRSSNPAFQGNDIKTMPDVAKVEMDPRFREYTAELARSGKPLRQKVGADGKAYFTIFDEDGYLTERYDKSRFDLQYEPWGRSGTDRESGLDRAVKSLVIYKLNPFAKYMGEAAAVSLARLNNTASGKEVADTLFQPQKMLPISAQNMMEWANTRAASVTVDGTTVGAKGGSSIIDKVLGGENTELILNDQALFSNLAGFIGASIRSEQNTAYEFAIENMRKANEFIKKVDSGEISPKRPNDQEYMAKYMYFTRELRPWSDSFDKVNELLNKRVKEINASGAKEKKEATPKGPSLKKRPWL